VLVRWSTASGNGRTKDPRRTSAGISLPNDPILLYRRGAYTESVRRRSG
jgi:hypothetical protein